VRIKADSNLLKNIGVGILAVGVLVGVAVLAVAVIELKR